MRQRRARPGFTLVEILVVLAIIATLLSLVAPRYFQTLDRSRETVLRHDLTVMRDAIDKYYSDTGVYPDTLDDLVERRYLRAVPVDPTTGNARRVLSQEWWDKQREIAEELERNLAGRPYPDVRELIDAGRD